MVEEDDTLHKEPGPGWGHTDGIVCARDPAGNRVWLAEACFRCPRPCLLVREQKWKFTFRLDRL